MSRRPATPAGPPWYVWLAPIPMLAGVIGGAAWVLNGPNGLWGYVVSVLFAISMGWIVISVLWPARADRTCPNCNSDKLERLSADSTVGIRCTSCGFVDDTKSSWLLAEEEGPLESIVLEQRRAKRTRRRRGQRVATTLQPGDGDEPQP